VLALLRVFAQPLGRSSDECIEIRGRFPPNLGSRIETVNAVADETMTQSLTAIGRVGYSFVARVLGYALMGEEVEVFVEESTGIINSPRSLHPSIMLVPGRNSESDTAGGRRRY
jgi:hypothetical protein